MTTRTAASAAATLLCLIATSSSASENDTKADLAKPYVTVNGVAQPNARAEILLREQISRGSPDGKELRGNVRDILIRQSLMEQAARQAGLNKEPLVQAQIDLAQQGVLAQAWQQKVLGGLTIQDSEIEAEYGRQVGRLGNEEYLIRHLLVAEESTAKLLIEKLQAGSKMADLAREYSRDGSTKDKGGLTEWTNLANFLPPIAAAIPRLAKGKFTSKPVQSSLGWHILQLDDTRSFRAPTRESLRPELTQIIARRMLEENIKALRDQAKIQ